MSVHNVSFPEDIAYGSAFGPSFNTNIIALTSGLDQRVGLVAQDRGEDHGQAGHDDQQREADHDLGHEVLGKEGVALRLPGHVLLEAELGHALEFGSPPHRTALSAGPNAKFARLLDGMQLIG